MKLKNISGRSQFMGTHKPQPDKNARIDLENQLKAQAERDGILKKYVKTNISPIENKDTIAVKAPCLFNETTNLPIEDITPLFQTDREEPLSIGLVSKTPYRDISTYKEEWYTHPIDD